MAVSGNIALVGFMGAGKTAAARDLARRLDRRLVVMDDLIESREKMSINDIFRTRGEPYFRDLETAVVRELSGEEGLVIDCGGGVVIREENIRNLKKNGLLIYLKASPAVILDRVGHQRHRPLLNVEDPLGTVRALLNEREQFYRQADHVIETDSLSIQQVIQKILLLLKND